MTKTEERERLAPLVLKPDQEEAVASMAAALWETGGALQAAEMGFGKLNPNTEPVLTPTGWRQIGALKVGDQVIGRDGHATDVIGVFPQGELEIVRVTFSDGSWSECGWDHLWQVSTPNRKFRQQSPVVLTTREILAKGLANANGNRRWYIPMVTPVEFDAEKLPIAPYVLGALLGDGHMPSSMLTTDTEVLERVLTEGYTLSSRAPHAAGYCENARVNGVAILLRELDLRDCASADKRIPRAYLFGSSTDRIALLQGLLDTDGSPVSGTTTVEYGTISPRLAEDVTHLVQSLGGTTSMTLVSEPRFQNGGIGQPYYRMILHLPSAIEPFSIERKRSRWVPRSKYEPTRSIVSIVPVRTADSTCIKVSAADELFVTRSFIVTHNTVVAVETMLNLGAQTILISAPLHVRYSWEDTVKRQTDYAIPFYWINNSNKAGKAAMESLKRGDAGFYFIGRELFRLTDWRGMFIDAVIHDECASLASTQEGGKKTRTRGYEVAYDLRQRTQYTIAQSATWFGSSFARSWSIGRILWPELIERNYYKWTTQYCKTVYDHFTPNQKKIVGEKTPGAFASSMPCYVNPPKSSNLAEPMYEDIFVDLSRTQRAMYDKFEKDGVVWLQDRPMVADVSIVQRIRLRQLTLAECTLNDDDQVVFQPNAKSTKFDALKEFLADLPDEKVIIATDSAKFARMVAARIGKDAFAWTGDATGPQREAAKGRFIKGDLKYLVVVQKAIAEGNDGLQEACHILVVLSEDDSPVMNSQLVGRLNRQGQTKRVLVYRMRARNTLDDPQAATLAQKARSMRESMMKDQEAVAA